MRELLDGIYAEWARSEYARTDWMHPDFELVFAPGFLDEGEFRGVDEASRGWLGWMGQWTTWRTIPERFIELDDGRIAVLCQLEGVSRTTGMELSQAGGNLWEFADGVPRRLVIYAHARDLLQDLGIDSP